MIHISLQLEKRTDTLSIIILLHHLPHFKKIKQVYMHSYHFSSIYQVPIPLLSMIYALSKLAFVTYCERGITLFLSSQIRKWRMKELK